MSFNQLNLIEPILKALTAEGYTVPTPIQQQAIPQVLSGRDLQGCAQTGTGKTAAFAIPIIQMLHQQKFQKNCLNALILTPTRELAIQIDESFARYGRYTNLKHTVIYGGVSQYHQVNSLRRGIEVLVATPGRLLDLINQGLVDLSRIEVFVLDEADRMLDMGFIHDVKKIISFLPKKRQTLLFSATILPSIQDLARTLLINPYKIEVAPPTSTIDKIEQSLYHTNKSNKPDLLLHLLDKHLIKNALVFTRTKYGADKLVRYLLKNKVKTLAIHGNKSQPARQLALNGFKNGTIRVLVATDIAARGIDIDELTHVFNYDLPEIPETYIHRIGRTGRAGKGGNAIAFCDVQEKSELFQIEKLIGKRIPIVALHPYSTVETDQVMKQGTVQHARNKTRQRSFFRTKSNHHN